jgi:predicted CXXCH cytochrome family protein
VPSTRSRSKPATKPPTPAKRKVPRLAIVLAVLVALAVVLTAGGFTFAASQEQRDPFCASCHTQPESTFYTREGATVSDLASSHHGKEGVRCIDCHSGTGIQGRVQAELLGAHNALAWYTGTAVQPAKLTKPIADENCVKCHADISAARTMQNHFHFFLPEWQKRDPNAAKCVTCHDGHATDGRQDIAWLNEQRTVAVCQRCHAVLGGGDD